MSDENIIETKEYADGTTATGIATLPDKSPAEQDASTGTWVDDGAGVEYPSSTDDYHSGTETPITLEERFEAVLIHLEERFGIHFPAQLAPKR